MRNALGLDACRGGWLAVSLMEGAWHDVRWVGSAVEALAAFPEAQAVGVDIPIGLLDVPREADAAGRRALGRRSSTLFPAPSAAAAAEATHAAANRAHRAAVGQGLSAQSFHLMAHIADAARIAHDARVHEVHPELLFLRLSGSAVPPKRTWNGMHRRRALLRDAGVDVPEALSVDAPADDVLDAAAAALVADHVLLGLSPAWPSAPAQRDANGRWVVIRG